jgi:hypothetical protein
MACVPVTRGNGKPSTPTAGVGDVVGSYRGAKRPVDRRDGPPSAGRSAIAGLLATAKSRPNQKKARLGSRPNEPFERVSAGFDAKLRDQRARRQPNLDLAVRHRLLRRPRRDRKTCTLPPCRPA